MSAQYICHPDFAQVMPIHVFHKQLQPVELPKVDEKYFNRHILFRKTQVLPNVTRAIMRITADDYYKLYINGRFVTQGPAASYPHKYFFNEIDVTRFLQAGANTFAVHTYYQGEINRVWVSGDLRQMLWCELEADGKEVLVSDESWLCADHTGYTSCGLAGYKTNYLECYNSAAAEERFFAPDFDDSTWQHAAVRVHADYTLQKQPTEQLTFYDVLPQRIEKTENGLFLDFGQEMVGYLAANAEGQCGDTVIIRAGEELNEDGSVRWQMRCNCKYEEKWLLSGGKDTLRQFDYKAFRYIELEFPPTVQVYDLRMTVRHYPCVERAQLPSDNADLTRVLRLCANTIKYGTQENYVDCPTREKGQYLGDVSIAARAQAVLTGDTTMMKKAIRDFCASSFICPGIMAVSGSSLMQEIADYSLQLPAQVCWVYSIDGDHAFLAETEPYLTALYDYFAQRCNADGLLESITEKWNLVDWPANLRDNYDFPLEVPIGPGVHNVINAFWCGFLQSMDEFYTLLGKPKTGRTAAVCDAFRTAFYSESLGLYVDAPGSAHASLHANVLPLLFELGTDDEALRKRLVHFIQQKKLTAAGVYMAYFALAALMRHGETEVALQLTLDPGCWLNMLNEGGTTTFEAWGKDRKWNTSLFHPWATAPLIVFAKGVRPY